MSLASQLQSINYKPEVVEKEKGSREKTGRIKAFIITMMNENNGVLGARKLLQSIQNTGSKIDPFIIDATTRNVYRTHLAQILGNDIAQSIQYTWPIEGEKTCFKTGLFTRAYKAADHRKIIACTVSHMRLWNLCIQLDEPIIILESDALFERQFDYKHIENFRGICGFNDPFYATRKPNNFHQGAINQIHDLKQSAKTFKGLLECPSVDSIGDPPLPQGLAGNSAYIIKPWAAKLLIDKTKEIGIWPNDALICKQLFPFLEIIWPYYTRVQRLGSSTTA